MHLSFLLFINASLNMPLLHDILQNASRYQKKLTKGNGDNPLSCGNNDSQIHDRLSWQLFEHKSFPSSVLAIFLDRSFGKSAAVCGR